MSNDNILEDDVKVVNPALGDGAQIQVGDGHINLGTPNAQVTTRDGTVRIHADNVSLYPNAGGRGVDVYRTTLNQELPAAEDWSSDFIRIFGRPSGDPPATYRSRTIRAIEDTLALFNKVNPLTQLADDYHKQVRERDTEIVESSPEPIAPPTDDKVHDTDRNLYIIDPWGGITTLQSHTQTGMEGLEAMMTEELPGEKRHREHTQEVENMRDFIRRFGV